MVLLNSRTLAAYFREIEMDYQSYYVLKVKGTNLFVVDYNYFEKEVSVIDQRDLTSIFDFENDYLVKTDIMEGCDFKEEREILQELLPSSEIEIVEICFKSEVVLHILKPARRRRNRSSHPVKIIKSDRTK
jgi:hypothetical protein